MATAALEQRLTAEAAQGRRGEEREREKRLAAERELATLRRDERVRSLSDEHPSKAPSAEGVAAWEAIQARMREWLGEPTWRIWGDPVHPHRRPGADGGSWVLACPASSRDWVSERFGSAWESACGAPVRFVICDQSTASERSAG